MIEVLEGIKNRFAEKHTSLKIDKPTDLYIKSQIMGDAISTASIERRRYSLVTWLQQKILTQFTSGFEIVGIEYLQEAREKAKGEGRRLALTPRHKSDLESSIIRYVFAGAGFGQLINNARWIVGTNMLKRWYINPFMRSENVIYIATPGELKEVDQLINSTDEHDPQRGVLKNIQAIFKKTNLIALEKARQSAKRRENLIVYPEAGRSYDGLLRQAPEQVAVYFPRDKSTIVVPLVVYGAEIVNPPNKGVNWKKLIPGLRQKMRVVVGESYSSSEIWTVWKQRKDEARSTGSEEEINPAEWIMANIANIDPTNIKPLELARYKGLMQRFAPQRLSRALAEAA